jgi:RNA polymerase-interacting CarD/CdnL/TRCF family regulator
MLDDTPIKVGDELVEYGKVYKVFKIADKKMYDGKTVEHVFFKPMYETSDNQTLSCAVPLKNIKDANIRRPLEKKKVAEILTALTEKFHGEYEVLDVNEAKDILKLNSPKKSAKVLRTIWREINDDELNTTKSRKDVFELSMKTLAQEVALTYNLSLEKAEAKLQRALKKSLN